MAKMSLSALLLLGVAGTLIILQANAFPRKRAIPNWSPAERQELIVKARTSPLGPLVVYDVDKDDRLSKQEATAFPDGVQDFTTMENVNKYYMHLDKNGDGYLTGDELRGLI